MSKTHQVQILIPLDAPSYARRFAEMVKHKYLEVFIEN